MSASTEVFGPKRTCSRISQSSNVNRAQAIMSETQLGKRRVVIVGGGAGGLELATRLGDKYGRKGKLEITLIERNRTHVWKPKLHEIAAGSMDMAAHEVDYLAQSYWHGFRYRIGEMVGIDRDRRQVQVAPYIDAEDHALTGKRASA